MHPRAFQLFIILHLLTGILAKAESIAPSTRLSDLSEGTQIIIRNDLKVEASGISDRLYYHGHFDRRSYHPGGDVADWGNAIDSGVSIRALYSDGIIFKFESGIIFDLEQVTYLSRGTYCMSKRESAFRSHTAHAFQPARDRLVFRDCRTRELTLILYVTAGYRLRYDANFHGLTVRDFDDQVGSAIKLRQAP
jgi:hypothetical protein